MGQMVRCDICGKVYNESNITTHKRRSHRVPGASPHAAEDSAVSVEAILSMYERLPDEQKKEVLRRLAPKEHKKP